MLVLYSYITRYFWGGNEDRILRVTSSNHYVYWSSLKEENVTETFKCYPLFWETWLCRLGDIFKLLTCAVNSIHSRFRVLRFWIRMYSWYGSMAIGTWSRISLSCHDIYQSTLYKTDSENTSTCSTTIISVNHWCSAAIPQTNANLWLSFYFWDSVITGC